MFERWYKIKGITKDLYEAWKDDLRKDIITWENGDKIEARIKLNPIQAKIMEHQIKDNNVKQNNYKLRLVKM